MMKKKLTSLILTLCMLLVPVLLVSCDDDAGLLPEVTTPVAGDTTPTPNGPSSTPKEPTAKELEKQLTDAMEKVDTLKELDAKYDFDIVMKAGNETVEMPITMLMKAKDLDKEDPTTYVEMTMDYMGETVEVTTYQEDGWTYTVTNGMSYKMETAASDEEQNEAMNGFLADVEGKNLFDMDKITYKNNADGSRTVTVAIDEETFGEIFTEAMAMVEEMTQLDANMNAELRDTAIEYTIKGGYVIAMTLKYGVDMTIEGTKMTMDIDMTMEIIDPGKPVTITPPEGYKDFEDIGDLYA